MMLCWVVGWLSAASSIANTTFDSAISCTTTVVVEVYGVAGWATKLMAGVASFYAGVCKLFCKVLLRLMVTIMKCNHKVWMLGYRLCQAWWWCASMGAWASWQVSIWVLSCTLRRLGYSASPLQEVDDFLVTCDEAKPSTPSATSSDLSPPAVKLARASSACGSGWMLVRISSCSSSSSGLTRTTSAPSTPRGTRTQLRFSDLSSAATSRRTSGINSIGSRSDSSDGDMQASSDYESDSSSATALATAVAPEVIDGCVISSNVGSGSAPDLNAGVYASGRFVLLRYVGLSALLMCSTTLSSGRGTSVSGVEAGVCSAGRAALAVAAGYNSKGQYVVSYSPKALVVANAAATTAYTAVGNAIFGAL